MAIFYTADLIRQYHIKFLHASGKLPNMYMVRDQEEYRNILPIRLSEELTMPCHVDCYSCKIRLSFSRSHGPTWADVLTSVLLSLSLINKNKTYFSLGDDIYQFIEDHWKIFFTKPKTTAWRQTAKMTLAHNRYAYLFENGYPVLLKCGYWKLKDDIKESLLKKCRKNSPCSNSSDRSAFQKRKSPSSSGKLDISNLCSNPGQPSECKRLKRETDITLSDENYFHIWKPDIKEPTPKMNISAITLKQTEDLLATDTTTCIKMKHKENIQCSKNLIRFGSNPMNSYGLPKDYMHFMFHLSTGNGTRISIPNNMKDFHFQYPQYQFHTFRWQ